MKKKVKKQLPKNKKKMAKKKTSQKKAVKRKIVGKRKIGTKTMAGTEKQVRRKHRSLDSVAFSLEESVARSGGQSGDLQGLSHVETADSESVDELLEEGNAFEADVVKGVEEAGNAEGREVHTHEVPEDDVPGEYRDKD
ncbi:MAG TPA: hypothetical protein VK579_02320 [Terriglobales bacterium]|nr:hypothetical protein [Terriglobales bacterium]